MTKKCPLKNPETDFTVQTNLMQDIVATPIEKLVYYYLRSIETSNFNPSYGHIALKCDCSDKSAKRAIKSLIDMKIIRKTRRYDEHGRNTFNEYFINHCSVWEVELKTYTTIKHFNIFKSAKLTPTQHVLKVSS